ncbi:MAG TPA: 16S rRNA (guanine(966)-N(2))-methyltransferase RsmD [Tepidisphaeraceae bacterium]
MRIIAGEFRGRRLLPPVSDATRPITDRAKQSLFDIASPLLPQRIVYDCFAGTGSMGLESLSRAAAKAVFFERDRSALERLKKNIQTLQVKDRSRIVAGDIYKWFDEHRPADADRAGVIFLDPPYQMVSDEPKKIQNLAAKMATHHLAQDGVLVFRHHSRDELELPGLRRYDHRTYGEMIIEFFRKQKPRMKQPDAPTSITGNRDDALAIVQTLRDAGHIAYFAGGCVRDELLGIKPEDYDIATDAPPQRVRELFKNTQAVGAAFGVILVRHRGSIIEVATFRTDAAYRDGRHPTQVHFTNAEQDAKRRDFTINGIFLDPIENRVIDFVGGHDDLKAKRLRAIGEPDHRFEEDHLRLLRAVRFAARFDLSIESATAAAITKHAPHLKRISPERIADELRRMLTPITRISAWKLLGEFGLLQVIFRGLPEKSIWPPNIPPLFPAVAPQQPIAFSLALATICLCYRRSTEPKSLIDSLLGTQEIHRCVQACRTMLKISNEESDAMSATMNLLALLGDEPPGVATLKRFLAKPTSPLAKDLLEAIRSIGEHESRIGWLMEQFAILQAGEVAPQPFVSGDDLTAAGLKPGKMFKRILDEVYDAQLEARIDSKEQAMEMAMRIASSGSAT